MPHTAPYMDYRAARQHRALVFGLQELGENRDMDNSGTGNLHLAGILPAAPLNERPDLAGKQP